MNRLPPRDKAFVFIGFFLKIQTALCAQGRSFPGKNEDGQKVFTAREVFPDASPAMALRGFRGKMEWTQQELAEKLGTTQNCISDMESGKRPISKTMAVRLSGIFNIAYKVFLSAHTGIGETPVIWIWRAYMPISYVVSQKYNVWREIV